MATDHGRNNHNDQDKIIHAKGCPHVCKIADNIYLIKIFNIYEH